jgi:hypothetical protein
LGNSSVMPLAPHSLLLDVYMAQKKVIQTHPPLPAVSDPPLLPPLLPLPF